METVPLYGRDGVFYGEFHRDGEKIWAGWRGANTGVSPLRSAQVEMTNLWWVEGL